VASEVDQDALVPPLGQELDHLSPGCSTLAETVKEGDWFGPDTSIAGHLEGQAHGPILTQR
jgi:hypothetical protein